MNSYGPIIYGLTGGFITLAVKYIADQFVESHKARIGIEAKAREKHQERQGAFLIELHVKLVALYRCLDRLNTLYPFSDPDPFTDARREGREAHKSAFDALNDMFVFYEDSEVLLTDELSVEFWKFATYAHLKILFYGTHLGFMVTKPLSEIPYFDQITSLDLRKQVRDLRNLMRGVMCGTDRALEPKLKGDLLAVRARFDSIAGVLSKEI